MTPRCYIFAGGGTGGHLTPGLAVAAELRRDEPDCRIAFVGTDRPIEAGLIGGAGYAHMAIPVESSRTLRRNPFRFIWGNWCAYRDAWRFLEQENPAGIVGLGGYASVPTVLAASRRRIPTILLEQNAIPGRATRFLCRRVGAVCAAFAGIEHRLASGARVVVTGNPVRPGIAELFRHARPAGDRRPTLLVLGGSQGAESLNSAMAAVLSRKPAALADWRVVHQTGPAQFGEVEQQYQSAGLDAVVQPFFDDMASLFASATLVISRAGATTMAELACAGCPAILLPYRHAADNHQLANARIFENAGAAIVIEHDKIPESTADNLARAVDALATDPSRRAAMQQALYELARPDAARCTVDVLQSLIAGGTP
ncbi:MAG: undecaprenyldiphospho-muramoylpentapeptide beta-N-acetylglucosaminyltransferase [Planctomycetia bacterium]|nr:undecaprenyldiphospho-muramoylpentapeptide beta-N-acetylglucosaminyltransferase [Planctomycetia bacterium]